MPVAWQEGDRSLRGPNAARSHHPSLARMAGRLRRPSARWFCRRYGLAMEFEAKVELAGKTATGFHVPDEVVTALASGRRPAVLVTVGGHTYRTTVGSMGGRFMVPLSAENRAAAGVAAGDEVVVKVEVDSAPREVALPDDLAQVLASDEVATAFFHALAPSHRKEWVRWIEDAKKPETRSARVAETVRSLQAGKRTRTSSSAT